MQNQGRVRVMLVDDNPLFLEILQELLSQDHRFQVICVAETGEEALEELGKGCPDLVLVDFQLPGLNGLETGRRVKQKCSRAKVALITAMVGDKTEPVFHRFAKEAGIHEVISKSGLTLEKIKRLVDGDSCDFQSGEQAQLHSPPRTKRRPGHGTDSRQAG